jgi:hypothetical protein
MQGGNWFMKNLHTIAALLVIGTLVCCNRNSNRFQASVPEDRALFTTLNQLDRNPNHQRSINDLPELYKKSIERHRQAIAVYRNSTDPERWDRILTRLNAMQNIYTSLAATPAAKGVVEPGSVLQEIQDTRMEAAGDFYARGMAAMAQGGRVNNMQAFELFQRANRFVSGYRDVSHRMTEAYERALIRVVINPIREDNLFFSGFNNWMNDFRFRPDEFQRQLARDLGGQRVNNLMARFYTDDEVRRAMVIPDVTVDMAWRSLTPLRNFPSAFTRRRSRRVQIGVQPGGRPIFKTVHATVRVYRRQYSITANLFYEVHDRRTNRNVDFGTLSSSMNWSDSYATFFGDARALTPDDWRLINNSRVVMNGPMRGDVMNTLMRRVYPTLLSRIQRAILNIRD